MDLETLEPTHRAIVTADGKGGMITRRSELFRQRVSPTCVAEVNLEGTPTQQAIDKLIAYLNLMKDTLPTET